MQAPPPPPKPPLVCQLNVWHGCPPWPPSTRGLPPGLPGVLSFQPPPPPKRETHTHLLRLFSFHIAGTWQTSLRGRLNMLHYTWSIINGKSTDCNNKTRTKTTDAVTHTYKSPKRTKRSETVLRNCSMLHCLHQLKRDSKLYLPYHSCPLLSPKATHPRHTQTSKSTLVPITPDILHFSYLPGSPLSKCRAL